MPPLNLTKLTGLEVGTSSLGEISLSIIHTEGIEYLGSAYHPCPIPMAVERTLVSLQINKRSNLVSTCLVDCIWVEIKDGFRLIRDSSIGLEYS